MTYPTSRAPRRGRRLVLPVATAAGTLVATGLLALPPAQAAGGSVPLASNSVPGTVRVVLPTGERVLVHPGAGGRQDLQVERTAARGAAAEVFTLDQGDHRYVIPWSATRYLGRSLDPSLFDVTEAAGRAASARVPVLLDYTGATPTALPGVTIDSAAGGHATGHLTAASARQFGAALARQATADAASAQPTGAALFGSVTRIAAPVAPVVAPQFPMLTLVVRGVDHLGRPLSSFVTLRNSDDGRKGGGFVTLVNGVGRISVPAGHYHALGLDNSFDAGLFTTYVPFVNDFDLTTNLQTMTVDARTATAASPTLAVPAGSRVQNIDIHIEGYDDNGRPGIGVGTGVNPLQGRLRMTPVGSTASGRLREFTKATVTRTDAGSASLRTPVWIDEGIAAGQRHTLPADGAASWARVDSRYFGDGSLRISEFARLQLLPEELTGTVTPFLELPTPLVRTEYVWSTPGQTVIETAILNSESETGPGFVSDVDPHPVRPGGRRSQSWFRTPYQVNPYDFAGSCLSCRNAGSMAFITTLTDSVDGHSADLSPVPGGEAAHLTVRRNGTVLVDEPDVIGALFDVPAAAGDFVVTQTDHRTMELPRLSGLTTTQWSFRSGSGQGPAPGPGTDCPIGTGCRVLPLLKAVVDLHPTIEGRVPSGTRSFDVAVGRIAGAATAPVSSVTVQVRPFTGTVWRTLPVTSLGGGRYRAAFSSTAAQAGERFDLRVTAVDATGSRIQQTVTAAVQIDG